MLSSFSCLRCHSRLPVSALHRAFGSAVTVTVKQWSFVVDHLRMNEWMKREDEERGDHHTVNGE